MTGIIKWNPFREFDSFLSNGPSATHNSWHNLLTEAGTEANWTPAVDIVEDDKEFLFKVELADLSKDDIKVKVDDGVLAISGERKTQTEEKGKTYHRRERSYGKFERSFILPEDSDPEQVRAEFTNGILNVHLPKNEKAKPKTIDIKVN